MNESLNELNELNEFSLRDCLIRPLFPCSQHPNPLSSFSLSRPLVHLASLPGRQAVDRLSHQHASAPHQRHFRLHHRSFPRRNPRSRRGRQALRGRLHRTGFHVSTFPHRSTRSWPRVRTRVCSVFYSARRCRKAWKRSRVPCFATRSASSWDTKTQPVPTSSSLSSIVVVPRGRLHSRQRGGKTHRDAQSPPRSRRSPRFFSQGFEPPMLVFVQSKDRARQLYTELAYDRRIPAGLRKRGKRGCDPLRPVEPRQNRGNQSVPDGGNVGTDRDGSAGPRTGLFGAEYRG